MTESANEGRPRTVLLTGFGPFPGVETNASSLLVARLAPRARRRFPDHRFAASVLPTEWERGPRRLDALLSRHQPDVILHFGVAARASGFEFETTARNACAAAPDASGAAPLTLLNAADGPVTRMASLPAAEIVARLTARAIPAQTSDDAGVYLCNAVLYRSLTWCEASPRASRAGFIHIPSTLAGAGSDGREPQPGCPLGWPDAIEGALIVLEHALALHAVGEHPLALIHR